VHGSKRRKCDALNSRTPERKRPDLIFAGNRVRHPGERRLIAFAERECACLPEALGADVRALVKEAGGRSGDLIGVAEGMLDRLRASGLEDTRN
jgi:hypothetical protein